MSRPGVHRPHMRPTPQPNLRLPLEVIGTIGECLIGSYQFGTLAKLNRTCKAVRAETLPILYETLTWDNQFHAQQREWWVEVFQGNTGKGGTKFPEGWKYVSKTRPNSYHLLAHRWTLSSRNVSVPRDTTTSLVRKARSFWIQSRRYLPRSQAVHLA